MQMLQPLLGLQQAGPRRRRLLRPPAEMPREAIELAVVQVFGIAYKDMRRSTRGRAKVALARQVAMYLAHVGCGLTLTETGRLFDRDRTTVAHACGVIEDRRDDPIFDRSLDLLEWAVPALTRRPFLPA
ncbi:MAG: helix-turn-helix domain-containing protein [Hyphomicrobium sp.]